MSTGDDFIDAELHEVEKKDARQTNEKRIMKQMQRRKSATVGKRHGSAGSTSSPDRVAMVGLEGEGHTRPDSLSRWLATVEKFTEIWAF